VSAPALFRAVAPVTDIARAVEFYERVLGVHGDWVGPGRVYFGSEGAILVCYDARAEGDEDEPGPNGGHFYFAVADLDSCFARVRGAGPARLEDAPAERAWGERSFYARDPFGNPLCFVQADTRYLGATA
jgi:catechol 2,3-dioxygenase-like lactoylglutathione lyase family enzyme